MAKKHQKKIYKIYSAKYQFYTTISPKRSNQTEIRDLFLLASLRSLRPKNFGRRKSSLKGFYMALYGTQKKFLEIRDFLITN